MKEILHRIPWKESGRDIKDLSHQSIRRSINNGLKHDIGFKMSSSVFETCAI